MKRWVTILAVAILEVLAIIGALPLLSKPGRFVALPCGLWENQMALIGFLLLAAGGTAYYTRRESKTVRVTAPIIIVGALLLTITVVQALT
jgi:hypothetical protein